MAFNSIEFLIFFLVVFLIYWLLCKCNQKLQNGITILASFFFYCWWNWRFLGLLLITIVSTFFAGIFIDKYRARKKIVFILTILLNLGLLVYYKYANFFIESFVDVCNMFGASPSINTLNIIVPIGISFYIFTSLSYVIDVYKEKVPVTRDWMAYFAYSSFFPALFSGPIGRATDQLQQFFKKRDFKYHMAASGCRLFLWGLFMKLCVADRLGLYIDAVYSNLPQHNGSSLLLASILYPFQLYCDFGGYSIMAKGCGRLLGIELQDNFIRSYLFPASISDYWKRTHISLTNWLMDYVYYPLIGKSDKLSWWNICMIITFLVSGLWHGAEWSFILWGLYNGVLIVISTNIARKRRKFEKKHNLLKNIPYGIVVRIVVFVLCALGLVFFRANNVSDAFSVIGKIICEPGEMFLAPETLLYGCFFLLVLLSVDFIMEFKKIVYDKIIQKKSIVRWVSYVAISIAVLLFGVLDNGAFIYFQF